MKTGTTLISDIDSTSLNPGEVAFWWLGQHSFILKLGDQVIYLDPYLANNPDRKVPPMFTPRDAAHATLICGTHDHGDHIDWTAWPDLSRATSATFVVPELVRDDVIKKLGITSDRVLGVDDGTSIEVGGLRLTGVAAAHELLEQDPATGLYPYLGYLIEANGCKVYHAGDTCKYEGLETRVKKLAPIDVAFLPINGRDARRLSEGCAGNMTYQEAVDLAGAVDPRLTIPTHFDMFENNSEDPQLFLDYLRVKFPGLQAQVCEYGEKVLVSGCAVSREASHETEPSR